MNCYQYPREAVMIITYQTTRWMEIDPAVFRSSTLVGINILPEYKLFMYYCYPFLRRSNQNTRSHIPTSPFCWRLEKQSVDKIFLTWLTFCHQSYPLVNAVVTVILINIWSLPSTLTYWLERNWILHMPLGAEGGGAPFCPKLILIRWSY